MNSQEVQSLKNELHRFEPKPCRSCQLIFGFGLLVFLISLTLFLFAQKGVPPTAIIPVESIPREKPLSFAEETVILDELRLLSEEQKKAGPRTSSMGHENRPATTKKLPIEVLPQ